MTTSRKSALLIAAVVAVVFGALTIFSGGRALFGGTAARAAVGDAVPFVLWFNFLAGFAYVAAGIGLILRHHWAVWLSIAILAGTVLVLLAFGVHVMQGGVYEMRTVGAMILRTVVWAAIAVVALRNIGRAAAV
ncbi:hypothetical protein [Aurantimonas sp. A3-2-R12]|uniref:hypothetical protein n=1 Tax=Aurantimonas sp. A3-2-R12 TaxID=3114362 RepID=UPI002E173447|nr:hypothetical protein [Aurantimonas sp. A3-2-R12]